MMASRQFCSKLSTCGFEKQDDRPARDVQKSLLTCRAKLLHEKKMGFSTGLRPALGKLLASWGGLLKTWQYVRRHFLVRSRQCVTDWVEIRVFLCL